ncbi:MAG: (Fe-S)-binding protein [Desulfobacteraceae bacterium]|nr:MAG: (Fe-S)-binding protein [Desulfobacteraceae bacterium]
MALLDYKYKDVIHRCFRCGYCKFPGDWSDVTNCPAYARYRLESYSAGGRLWLIRAWIEGEIEWSQHLAEIVYACAACKNCVEKCPLPFREDIVQMVVAARNTMVAMGRLPAAVKTYLQNVQLHGNPYGLAAKRRGAWMQGLDVATYSGQEFLYFVGCEGAYDTRAKGAARALALLLRKAGVSFGVLGSDETADGNDIELLGEEGLTEALAEKNIRRFNAGGAKKIITLSPHAYNAFKNIYPRFGGRFEVFHYTQILADLIGRGKFQAAAHNGAAVAFHDPCFLGRWNNEYHAPRKILKSIPGLRLVEMERSRKSTLCCGGGSGNYVIDLLGGSEDSPARLRVREAHAAGAGVLAVACPNCLTMLEDAVKVEGLEEKLSVRDVAELANGAQADV